MRIINVPARYAPYVEQTLSAMKATIDADPLMLDTELPWRGVEKDESATGMLMIRVAYLPADAEQPVFALVDQPARMERSA